LQAIYARATDAITSGPVRRVNCTKVLERIDAYLRAINCRSLPCFNLSMSLSNESEWSGLDAHEPLPGSHVVTPRRGYLHHGIYAGSGRVVHYPGLAYSLRRGPVEETSLARFTDGRPIRVIAGAAPSHFDRCEVVRRARSRVGENSYRLFSNNCEHFCEWCVNGAHRSYQVEALLRQPARSLRLLIRFVSKVCSIIARILLGRRAVDRHCLAIPLHSQANTKG
jgi:hypothetical protein